MRHSLLEIREIMITRKYQSVSHNSQIPIYSGFATTTRYL